jgi:hypothetical protein
MDIHAGESYLSCPRPGISAPPLKASPLLYRCQEDCLPQCKEKQYSSIKKQEPQLPHCGDKRAIMHHDKNTARDNVYRILLSGENCWKCRRKHPKPQPQGQKGLKP